MKTHYRRISKTALANLLKPEGASLGEFGAVKVGAETGGWTILEVVDEDRDGLPGTLISESFGGLKGAARSAVHRSKIRKTVAGAEVTQTVPANKVVEGDAVLQEGINPHRFI